MKQSVAVSLVLALSVGTTALSHAQSGDMKGMDMKGMDMKGMESKSMSKDNKAVSTHKATGVVKKIDAQAGTVTLDHEPVKSLNWPAMTMTFKVKDKKMLDKLAMDKKVHIEFQQHGKENLITAVK